MVQSMTGYGKAEGIYGNNKVRVEIRSVNGKSAEISIKSQMIPREREIEVRRALSNLLVRGSIDLFITMESLEEQKGRALNQQVILNYIKQLQEIALLNGQELSFERALTSALRLPEVVENNLQNNESQEEIEESWSSLFTLIVEAANRLIEFRQAEGEVLKNELLQRISQILELLKEVEQLDPERNEAIKNKILAKVNEAVEQPDSDRFEQELIYYLEKLDITEEKVRLLQHCNYFTETIEQEENPGKKLGFISQEIGREINTLGSKANHAQIQRIVVMMKDQLEKIKEQSLNLL